MSTNNFIMKKYCLITCICSMVWMNAAIAQTAANPRPARAIDTSSAPLSRKMTAAQFFKVSVEEKAAAYKRFIQEIPDTGTGQLAWTYDLLRRDIAESYVKADNKREGLLWLDSLRTPQGICEGNIRVGELLLKKDEKGEAPFVEKRLRPLVDSTGLAFRRNGSERDTYNSLMPVYVKALLVLQQPERIVYVLQPLYAANGNKLQSDPRVKGLIKPEDYKLTENLGYDYGMALAETGHSKEAVVVLARLYLTGDEVSHQLEDDISRVSKKFPGGEAYYKHITDSVHQYYKAKLNAFAAGKVDMNGKPVDFASLKGKYVLLDFWGSWCKPCRASHPHLKELYAKYKDKGFEIIGIAQELAATPEQRRKLWTGAIEQDGLSWLQVMDNENIEKFSAVKEYGVGAFPTKILLDRDGNIIGRYVGNGVGSTGFTYKLEELLGK